MTPEDIVNMLMSLERRLATISDEAHETREQAQHTLDRINRLRLDVGLLKQNLTASLDTINFQAEAPR
jgi:hypothetical protein